MSMMEYYETLDLLRRAEQAKQFETNADRFRAMSDEELAEWAQIQIACGRGFFPCGSVCDGKCEAYSPEECKEKILKWLKQPAEVMKEHEIHH